MSRSEINPNAEITTTRNLWPFGVILALVIFVGATAGLIVLASTQNVDLVSDDYYEQEINYQDRLDSLERTKQFGDRASVVCDSAARRVIIAVPAEHVKAGASGWIQLYRPSPLGMDRELKFEPDRLGVQSLDISDLRKGLWKVRVSWKVEDQEYFLDEKIVVGAAPN